MTMRTGKKLIAGVLVGCMILSSLGYSVEAASKKKQPKLSTSSISLEIGKTQTVKLKVGTKASWSVKSKKIAKITKKKSGSATVKGLKSGTTTLVARVNGKTLNCKISVSAKSKENTNKGEKKNKDNQPSTSAEYVVPTTEVKTTEEVTTEYVDPCENGHTYGDSKITIQPTCSKEGESTKTCTKCGKEEKEVIPTKDHSYVWVQTKTASFLELGEKKNICSICKDIKEVQPIERTNSPTSVVKKTNYGIYTVRTEDIGDSNIFLKIEATKSGEYCSSTVEFKTSDPMVTYEVTFQREININGQYEDKYLIWRCKDNGDRTTSKEQMGSLLGYSYIKTLASQYNSNTDTKIKGSTNFYSEEDRSANPKLALEERDTFQKDGDMYVSLQYLYLFARSMIKDNAGKVWKYDVVNTNPDEFNLLTGGVTCWLETYEVK